ncbi:hypothetical protein ONE63_011358 [Megalurothrips usitatus]|uniref:Uncharacterized protein n=1 Tax=Megalurothrips usitatus TaxID=439358 RepID=A0AAV7X3I4_9NEOP|nr:hypothetical protein ONE63_011358 [Megalurothrips usitatus]
MVLKLALYEFICVRKLFTVFDFNSNLNMFVYGSPDVKNKPSPNIIYRKLCDNCHSLKQSGSQTFCLLRIFFFVITGVEAGDPYLELVQQLQDIVRIVFSFEVTEGDILHLENLVEDFQKLFHNMFVSPPAVFFFEALPPDVDAGEDNVDDELQDEGGESSEDGENVPNVPRRQRRPRQSKRLKKGINKLHHIKHYGPQIREKGPLIRLWCAKIEGRHRIFRKHAGVQSNFKNSPKTMASMFQLSTLGPVLAMKEPRKERGFKAVETTTYSVENSPYCDLLQIEGLRESDMVKAVKSVKVSGIEYSTGLFVPLKGIPPEFGLISDILAIEKQDECPSRVFLVVTKCISHGIDASSMESSEV